MFGPLISVLAVILGLVLVGPISPASSTPGNGNNDECVPSDAAPASFGDWTNSGDYTDWQSTDTAPDPDGQSGDNNPLNLKQAGAIDQKSVDDADGYTLYYTGSGDGSQDEADAAWIPDSSLSGWTQFDSKTVTDSEASDEQVVDSYTNWEWHPGNDPVEIGNLGPAFPDTDHDGGWWGSNEGNHTGHPQPGDPQVNELGNYFRSNNSNGIGDWFHWEAVYKTVHTDAVTHTEYRYSKDVPSGSHSEYRWAIQTRTYTPAKDAVTCDHNPGGNNGSIKVDDDGLPGCNVGHSQGSDVCDNGVGNDPHLGCTFYVEWYNYEANATSTVTFEVQDPTGGSVTAVQGAVAPDTVTLDGDDASGANEAGFDGSELYQLSFTDAPQKNHGWHVKVTTHTTWANGSEDKFKTFWVEGDCGTVPEPTTRTEHHSEENCDIGGVHTWDVLFTTTYAWDEEKGEYVGTEDAGVIENDVTTPYTHDEAIEHGCTSVPEPTTRTEHHSEDGCEVGGVHTWDVVFTTTYAWDEEKGVYVGTEDAGVIENDVFTVYTHDQQVELGCTTLPEPLERIVHQSEQSCDLGGVHTWDDVYTTTFAWDEETGGYVGTETGPVAENDLLTPYTAQQAEDLGCVEVEGEQTHGHHGGGKHHPEVKGEQAHAPAAAVVPTQVEAGLAGTPAGTPAGGSGNNLPLWALSLGAGMFLAGAGRLRRTSRATR